MNLGVIDTTLQTVATLVREVRDNFTSFYTTTSLAEATKLTRVEPLTIVSKDLLNLEYMPDVQNAMLSIFAGYYLQAVAMLTKVNDVEVVKFLDRLNPDRDEMGFLLSTESYKHSLSIKLSPALENNDNLKTLQDVTNLSVGKLLNVEISYKKKDSDEFAKVTVPVSVRLMTSVVPDNTISHLLTYKTEDTGVVERYHAWRSGRIAFIKDLIFCQDLIDEYKRAHVGDDTGTMQEIVRRVNNSKKFGLLTKTPSLVSASNLFVISEEVARTVESKLGGKLSNPRIRQKAFDNTYAMVIAVVDREWERVTFYTRGLSASSDLSIKEIKSASKSKGGLDIMDVLKSVQQGMPAF